MLLVPLVMLALGIAGVLAVYDYYVVVPTGRDVPGTVVGLYKNQRSKVYSPTLFVARLDDGRSVVVECTEALAYAPDARIVMQERRSAVFGFRHYAFNRFARSAYEEQNNDARTMLY